MRCTQWMGLSSEAQGFLCENANMIGSHPCPHCGLPTSEDMELVDNDKFVFGMFCEEIPLKAWRLKDGRVAIEVEQASPWSSGPVIFTCLEVDGERIGEWPQEDIDNA